jgi:hypothetical protein
MARQERLGNDNLPGMAEVQAILHDLDLLGIQFYNINIDNDVFLDYLVNCIRNDVISFQRFLTKLRSEKKTSLISRLSVLKSDYEKNSILIKDLEAELNSFQDEEMKAELEKFRHFDVVNSEKITPEFLKLARSVNTDFSLRDVRGDNGVPFESEKARNSYILKYFADIYKKPKCDYNRGNDSIEQFLGPEITSSKLVTDSKLSDTERNSLETPISLIELDTALKEANAKSAPGLDGLSVKFIAKFWKFLRYPLFNYAATCFEKGILTTGFRSACVRLIPKKGDKSNLKLATNISTVEFL